VDRHGRVDADDQSTADADQTHSDTDQTGSESDQAAAYSDQVAADSDQAAADKDRGTDGATPELIAAHAASRIDRERATLERITTRIERAETAQVRAETAMERDRVADARDEAARLRDVARAQRRKDAAATRLLLVVEDNPGDARLLREMLRDQDPHGTELAHVGSMRDAEIYLAERVVDVILLDLGLPDAQGLEAVRRAKVAAPDVPLVVLTGLDDQSSALEALEEGAQDYLIKGQIDGLGLVRALRYAIERKTLQDAGMAAQGQVLQSQKLESLGRLAGGIAHDFNNILFAIHGYAELLSDALLSNDRGSLDPDGLALHVNAITRAAERAALLTAQLVAFSRTQVVAVKAIDLNAAMIAIEPMLNRLTGANRKLIIDLDPATGSICADGSQIDQVIVNLVVNARDATTEGGTVTVRTCNVDVKAADPLEPLSVAPGPFVLLTVGDDGIGMAKATRDHIFEPFFTTKAPGKGTGLGLATTYGIVRQAGGDISVDSQPGLGSTFKLYFPRVAAVAEQPAVPVEAIVGVGRVLVVDDDPAVRFVTARLLARAGYDVREAAKGAHALLIARQAEPFDVLVSDVVMPNMSGIELAGQMMDEFPTMGVVLLSGYTLETAELERVTRRGATFALKPVSTDQLLRAVAGSAAARQSAADPAGASR
jgi:signal transduction histidine kinase